MKDRVVKSAGRVLQVLEYFDEIRDRASVMEIARALKFPQSSTSGLLKSLESLGYLSFDQNTRQYAPTYRVSLLGSWIEAPQLYSGRTLRMMNELGDATGETIILGEQTGLIVRYIYVVPSRQLMRLHVGPGLIRPLATSGMGRLFLSTYKPERVRELLKIINAGRKPGEQAITMASLAPDLEEIRARGYAVSAGRITPGATVVATMLPPIEGSPPLAMSIGGFSDAIANKLEHFATLMRSAIKRYLT